ncbi:hypothetical protein D9619_010428 [Psilocybe cf. subviscida]|uniref:Uncharacterized protein n=1 Tax=Psilocybe cf. subviscida TaxID=2480587 RepID=A0A8H5ERR7_9AGAR|nr:hypothetical protein D9619_010428 [Psilocybe cf. subviscida]
MAPPSLAQRRDIIPVRWAGPALSDAQRMDPSTFWFIDPVLFQEELVREFFTFNRATHSPCIAHARYAKIRAAAHTGGSNPDAPDHVTVSFRGGGGMNLATVHIPTGRTAPTTM